MSIYCLAENLATQVFNQMFNIVGVTDLINRIVQVLKGDLYWVKISARDTELIKPVKL